MASIQKIDLHLHTLDDPMDHHVHHTAEELIDLATDMGFTALAITLHRRQFESERVRSYASERGIVLIPGVEQDVEGAHVLLLNFAREVADSIHTFAELRRAKKPDNMVVAAHPFYPNSTCLKERIFAYPDLFDAVEISGFYHRAWNPNHKAEAAAKRLGLPVIGNSDTHTLEQFGSIWTEVESEHNPVAILTALKQGRGLVKKRALSGSEISVVTWKVIAKGYMPWVNYKKSRRHSAQF